MDPARVPAIVYSHVPLVSGITTHNALLQEVQQDQPTQNGKVYQLLGEYTFSFILTMIYIVINFPHSIYFIVKCQFVSWCDIFLFSSDSWFSHVRVYCGPTLNSTR